MISKLCKNAKWLTIVLILSLLLSLGACNGNNPAIDSGDPAYEATTITIEGLEGGDKEISVTELRALPQHDLDASYKRTTGLYEEFKMSGPYIKDVIEAVGGKLEEYEGMGVIGSDGYYCLISKEVIDATPDMMLAVVIDGEAKLDEDNAPARLAVQGQFGPYWVKRVEKITLYKTIPEKEITSIWVFDNLAKGIEPYEYEYYGSKDKSIELEQIFARWDYVDSKAFFTMKSSDGFKKNETMSMVKSRYYIKVEGEDAPTNISPHIKLGMNVQHIAWISTNADAAIFPNEMMKYMTITTVGEEQGITLDEVLYETEVKEVKTKSFDILGTEGEKITVKGEDMSKGVLTPREDGGAKVIWQEGTGYKNIDNLMRIRLSDVEADVADQNKEDQGEKEGDSGVTSTTGGSPASAGSGSASVSGRSSSGNSEGLAYTKGSNSNTILTIMGNGVKNTIYLSLDDLKGMKDSYLEQAYSVVNNWPTKKFFAVNGVNFNDLLALAGIKGEAKTLRIEASDGYYATLTKNQLMETRFHYPNLLKDSASGAVPVKPIIAWAFKEGSADPSAAEDEDLRFFIGQKGLQEVNTAVSVQKTHKIIVSTDDPGSWKPVTFTASEGQVAIQHDEMDKVNIYYTTDGSAPTISSKLYNPSTTYFQPDLIKPIPVSGTVTIKAKVIGFGKNDSEVATYEFTVQ